jgi:signal transduction histidine kinase
VHHSEVEILVRVTSAIADAVTAERVYEAVVDLVGGAVGASSGALWLRQEDGVHARLVRAFGYSDSSLERFRVAVFDASQRFPVLDAITQGNPVFIASREELNQRYPHLVAFVTGCGKRAVCFPLVVDGRTLGGLAFTFDEAPADEESERRFLSLVVRYGGQAIERLRLLGVERRLRSRAEAVGAHMAVLGRVARLFSESSADLPLLLSTIAEQIALEAVGVCTVLLFADGDVERRVAVFPKCEESSHVDGRELLPDAADSDRRHVVELSVRGRQLGVVSATRRPEREGFTDGDRELVSEIAERAALVLERVLLYESSRRARERADLLYGLARVVIAAESAEPVLDAALDAIECAVRARRSAVLLCDAEGVMRFRASRGLSESYRSAVEGHSPWPREARSPTPVLIGDVRDDPALAHLRTSIEAEGIRALAFIPLVEGARLIGKFMVYYDEPRELSPQELDIASAIANLVASAIARLYAVSELRQTLRFNEMFTAILGHDLRNPLGAIMTAAQLAMKRYEDERLQKPLGRIVSSGQRMARMIDQLLDFTRVRVGGGLPLSPHAVDLLPLLRQIFEELESATPGVMLSLKAAGDTVGEWDAERLHQVFANLIGNAVQHGAAGAGAQVRVDGTNPALIRVDVVNGGAVPRELVGKLFDPMTGGETRGDKSQGLGLGLFITKQIVKSHGGTVDVQANEPDGTAFRVVLPRVAARAPGSP